MSFCTKCGNKLDEGARFCAVCGTPAGADNISQQPGQYQVYSGAPQQNPNLVKFNKFINEMLSTIGNIFAKPVSTITNVGENIETGTAFMIAGIFAVLYGLINMWIIKALTSSIEKLSLFGEFEKANYGKIFVTSLAAFALLVFIVFIVNYIVASYFVRAAYNPKALFKVTACAFTPLLFSKILFAIFVYISVIPGCIIYLIGVVLTLFLLYKGINNVLHINEDKCIYIIMASVIIAYLIFILINYYSIKDYLTSIF